MRGNHLDNPAEKRDRAGEQGAHMAPRLVGTNSTRKTHCLHTTDQHYRTKTNLWEQLLFFETNSGSRQRQYRFSSACWRTPRTLPKFCCRRTSPQ